MAALTGDLNISTYGDVLLAPMIANDADTYFQGAIVYYDEAGGVQVTHAAGDRVCGISLKQQTVAAGDEVQVCIKGLIWFPAITTIAATDEGHRLQWDLGDTPTDNIDTCDSSLSMTEAAGDLSVGWIIRYTAARTLIYISPGITGAESVGTAGTWD